MDISGNNLAAVENMNPAAPENTAVIKPLPGIEKASQVQTQTQAPVQNDGSSTASDMTREDIEEMVEALEGFADTIQTRLDFSVNEETNNIVVKVMDKDSEQVIKQFPPEQMLDLMEKMQDLSGLLFNADV